MHPITLRVSRLRDFVPVVALLGVLACALDGAAVAAPPAAASPDVMVVRSESVV